jgi:hypothetical protein
MTTKTKTPVDDLAPEGAKSIVMEIEPALLTVDLDVQRPLDSARAAGMAADFNRSALGVIHVSQRPSGLHHIIDGQTRVAAIGMRGESHIPITCVLWEGLSKSDEAAMFRKLNNTRQVQPLDRFRVRIVEGDPVACKLNEVLIRHGWTIQKSKGPGSFFAVSALEKVYNEREEGDLNTCDGLVMVATEAWGHDSNGLRAEIVAGLGVLLRRYPRLDIPKLVTELAKHEGGPLGLIGRAKQLRSIRGGRISDAMAEILVNLHNRRRATNRLPEWSAT